MKKTFFCLLIVLTLGLSGCNNLEDGNSLSFKQDKDTGSLLSKRITDLKKAGLLDELLSVNRSAGSSEELDMYQRFIEDTDSVLEEIKKSENGEEELAIINALFLGETVDDFANAFEKIDYEKAEEYRELSKTFFAERQLVSRQAVNSLQLCYLIDTENCRTIYGKDLSWNTIGWYTGFCAATVAGFYAFSYGGLWAKIAGGIAAAAGVTSMCVQLVNWAGCSDLFNLIIDIANKNVVGATNIINSEGGLRLATITVETAATLLACYFTPFGRELVVHVVERYNLIVSEIYSHFPKGIQFNVCGIPLKKIEGGLDVEKKILEEVKKYEIIVPVS